MTQEDEAPTNEAFTAAPAAKAPRKKAAKKAAKKAGRKVAKKAAKKLAKKRPAAGDAAAPVSGAAAAAKQAAAPAQTELAYAHDDEVTFRANIVVDHAEEPRERKEPRQHQQPDARKSFEDRREGQERREPRPPREPWGQREPKAIVPAAADEADEKKGQPQRGGPPQHERQKGHKFKNKNNKRGKPHGKNKPWQNKSRKSREEESAIELGQLLEWELLENFDQVEALAADLKSGGTEVLDYNRIYQMGLTELRGEAAARGVETGHHAPNRDQLINAITRQAGQAQTAVYTLGVLELLDDEEGGLLVYDRDNYRIRPLSAYLPQVFIERFGLKRGHIVKAQLHPHREGESCPFVVRVESVMGRDPETLSEIVPFTERVPYYPTSRILMESEGSEGWDNLSMRVVDCLTPVGFGQRGLIVAPPRTGKTVLMQGMANSIQKNYPQAHLIILLIDERPEEVTDFRRQVHGEVISSTFDESAESHVHAAEMVIEKARRMVEAGQDVVILLDSITRLARAYNTTMPSSGKILSGGVEANALQKPKRFFGSARNIEDGGSLTIMATALVETGSKMDEVIFEEFKGTGNMELHLDRGLSDKRIFPALSLDKSGTRKEELLYHPDEMQKIYSLRRAMKGLPSADAMEMLIQRIKKTNTNAEFLMSVAR